MVLLRFKEFHGLQYEQKIIRKNVNPWTLSYPEKIQAKKRRLIRPIVQYVRPVDRRLYAL